LLIYNKGEPPYDVEERRHINVQGLNVGADLNAVFTTIYRTNRWGSNETLSGEGSERSRMRHVTSELGRLIRELGIRSVLDAPCGDFNWMRDVNLDGVCYQGCDVVDDLINANSARYGGRDRSFRVLDFTVDQVPYADLILCRDTLVHLSYQHISASLRHFRESGSKYLLTTTFSDTRENEDIEAGWWRPINLQLPPFGLPEPLRLLSDKESEDHHLDKALALWDLRSLNLSAPADRQARGLLRCPIVSPPAARARRCPAPPLPRECRDAPRRGPCGGSGRPRGIPSRPRRAVPVP